MGHQSNGPVYWDSVKHTELKSASAFLTNDEPINRGKDLHPKPKSVSDRKVPGNQDFWFRFSVRFSIHTDRERCDGCKVRFLQCKGRPVGTHHPSLRIQDLVKWTVRTTCKTFSAERRILNLWSLEFTFYFLLAQLIEYSLVYFLLSKKRRHENSRSICHVLHVWNSRHHHP